MGFLVIAMTKMRANICGRMHPVLPVRRNEEKSVEDAPHLQ